MGKIEPHFGIDWVNLHTKISLRLFRILNLLIMVVHSITLRRACLTNWKNWATFGHGLRKSKWEAFLKTNSDVPYTDSVSSFFSILPFLLLTIRHKNEQHAPNPPPKTINAPEISVVSPTPWLSIFSWCWGNGKGTSGGVGEKGGTGGVEGAKTTTWSGPTAASTPEMTAPVKNISNPFLTIFPHGMATGGLAKVAPTMLSTNKAAISDFFYQEWSNIDKN